MANTKQETTFPVKGAMAGRLVEDDWELHPDVLRAWAAAQRAIQADRVREERQAATRGEAVDRDGEDTRAERRKRRWATIRARAGAAADGGE